VHACVSVSECVGETGEKKERERVLTCVMVRGWS